MRRRITAYAIVACLTAALIWSGGGHMTMPRSVPLAPPHVVQTLAPDQTSPRPGVEAAEPSESLIASRDATPEPAHAAAPGGTERLSAPEADDNAAVELSDEMARLEQELLALIAAVGGRWGIVYEELAPLAGEPARLSMRGRELFYAASTTKLPTVLCLYELAAKGEFDLTERMEYLPEDYWEGAGLLRYEEPGGMYSLRELAELAIRHSDNVATIMLERYLGLDRVNECFHWLGGEMTEIVANETTPEDMLTYLRALLRFQEREPVLGGELVRYLATTYYRHRIPAGLPPGVAVVNKTGTWPEQNADVAIVYLPDHPYALTVYVDGLPESAANAAIRAVATIVHRTAVKRAERVLAECREAAPKRSQHAAANACPLFEQ